MSVPIAGGETAESVSLVGYPNIVNINVKIGEAY